jgi:hypothetical protein
LQRAAINLTVIGNGEGLTLPIREDPAHLNVASHLRVPAKTEFTENLEHRGQIEPSALPSSNRRQLHGRQNGRVALQSQLSQILAIQVKSNRFLYVGCEFIQGFSLSDDRQVEAFSDILLVALADSHMNCLFQITLTSPLSV